MIFLWGRQVIDLEQGVCVAFIYSRIKGCAPDHFIFNPNFYED